MVRGYDFLVNAVWPELVANVEARTPSIFAPGNPNVFHQVFFCAISIQTTLTFELGKGRLIMFFMLNFRNTA